MHRILVKRVHFPLSMPRMNCKYSNYNCDDCPCHDAAQLQQHFICQHNEYNNSAF